MNYQRAPRTFVIAYETKDTVSSEWLVRGADGRECKPEDYLTAFARFVRENPAHIDAIRILLNRPRDWGTEALSELREKLASTPERFTVRNLQKAHEIHYRKALVDIISMIEHAPRQSSRFSQRASGFNEASRRPRRGRHLRPSSSSGSTASKHTSSKISRSIRRTSTRFRSFPARGAGVGRTRHSIASFRSLLMLLTRPSQHDRYRYKTLGVLSYPSP